VRKQVDGRVTKTYTGLKGGYYRVNSAQKYVQLANLSLRPTLKCQSASLDLQLALLIASHTGSTACTNHMHYNLTAGILKVLLTCKL
jgi:hypothetical protein